MIFRVFKLTLLSALVLLTPLAVAGEPVEKAVLDKLSAKLQVPAMGLTVESVSTSELPGLYEVQFANGGPLV